VAELRKMVDAAGGVGRLLFGWPPIGLLLAVSTDKEREFAALADTFGIQLEPLGEAGGPGLTITLAGDANLQHGTECMVTVSGVHDLLGNDIADGALSARTAEVRGDGDNIPEDQPILQMACFEGGGTPDAGEYLYLEFNEEMALESNPFSDQDVSFWDAEETLGSGANLEVALEDAFTVRVTLGFQPDFTPGSSAINLPELNDVVRDLAGNRPYMPAGALRNDYRTIIAQETQAPRIDLLTLNEIPAILNGDGSAGGRLLVPLTGFDISLEYHDVGGAGVDSDTLTIVSESDLTLSGSALEAGENLVPHLTSAGADDSEALFTVPAKLVFPAGVHTLKARVGDNLGNVSAYKSFTFETTAAIDALRPFETVANASQVWNLLFTRDLYTIEAAGGASISITAERASNGIADFNEDLIIFGLGCADPIKVPGTGKKSNVFMKQLVIDAVKDELHDNIFSGVNIVFTEEDQGTIPGNWAQVGYNDFTHSQISIGGESDVGALGVAFVDRGNANQDNDILYNGSAPYNPGTNLGIFTTRILKYEINGSSWGIFRTTFDTFIPGRGTPVGEGASDRDILMDIAGTGPEVGGAAAVRRDAMLLAVSRLARFIAVVTAHEMGHSMGLSVNGAMPDGLYGGDAIHFPGSDSNHINLGSFPDLYLLPAVNIMVPATNFWMTNAAGTRFNDLNRAYLREKAFYNP